MAKICMSDDVVCNENVHGKRRPQWINFDSFSLMCKCTSDDVISITCKRLQGPRSIFAIGGLNKMLKAFLARTTDASVLGGSRGINASSMAKNTSQYSRHSELFYYLSG